MIGPVKLGFHEGRIGFRLSPLLVGLNPSCGVNGKPDCRLAMPLIVQPCSSFSCQPFLPRPNGNSYDPLMDARCRTSVVARPQSKRVSSGNITNPGAFTPTLLLSAVPSSKFFE